MLFKRLHKHLDQDIEEHTEGSEGKQVEHTEEELEAHLQKLMKRQRRIVRLKKAVLYLIVGIGLLGGFRSLAQERPDITPAVAVNDYSFLEDYIKNYYKYPKDEESQQFLQEFTTGGSWNVSYDQKIKSAEVGTVEVYQVEPSDTEEGHILCQRIPRSERRRRQEETTNSIYRDMFCSKRWSLYRGSSDLDDINCASCYEGRYEKRTGDRKRRYQGNGLYGTGEAGDHEYDPVVLYDLCR